MILIYWINRKDGGYGCPIKEEHYQCSKCHLLLHKGIPLKEFSPNSFTLKNEEQLKALGYL